MLLVNPYLTFNGNCREGMLFYKKCLGGRLWLQTIGQSPLAVKMPATMKKRILHATLKKGSLILMATDMVGEKGLVKGNAVSLLLHCSSKKEIQNYYRKLASGGEATHPVASSFWGALFGTLTDKFGNHWLLQYDKKQNATNMKQEAALPVKLATPAQRALANAGISTLKQIAALSEQELKALHGIGENALSAIKQALKEKGLSFSKNKK